MPCSFRLMLAAPPLLAMPAYATVWDASSQFSATENPNGVWSYGLAPAGPGSFAPMSDRYDAAVPPALLMWHRDLSFPNSYPQVGKNAAPETVFWNDPGSPIFSGNLVLHPGPLPAVLRFTAPAAGTYTVNVSFSRNSTDCGPGSAAVRVFAAGTLLFHVVGNGQEPWIASTTATCPAGGTIDVLTEGADDGINCDHVQGRVVVSTAACGPADLGTTGGVPGADGVLDNNDFIVYIDYFFGGDPRADLGIVGGVPGQDGMFDNNDFVAFVDHFFTGC